MTDDDANAPHDELSVTTDIPSCKCNEGASCHANVCKSCKVIPANRDAEVCLETDKQTCIRSYDSAKWCGRPQIIRNSDRKKLCKCVKGASCPGGMCDNCLHTFQYSGDTNKQVCYNGWSQALCEERGAGYAWCGLHGY
eukprot:TRINITY_DN84519_c0_g1_i6.p1 TRINITY_DN84519_c0_g1~~TRINITY_DN84519_c0_g1_i6.p1  ORF type:complete len:139 (+),score=18.25 TRINITY_DN84519_c0_g1_i6:264-680(+)